jgi:hypothetical protein
MGPMPGAVCCALEGVHNDPWPNAVNEKKLSKL